MEAIGLLVKLEARRGKEAETEAFLKSAQPLALDEEGTLKWYAIKLGPEKFGIFDTFANEADRNAHLSGDIAKALGARASELLAVPPQIEKVEVLARTPLKEESDTSSLDPAASEALLARVARARLIEQTSYRFVDLFTFICGKVDILSEKLPSIENDLAALRTAAMKGVELNKRLFGAAEDCRRDIGADPRQFGSDVA